ncbi:MAG: alanine dehydrogenase, partial [Thermaerobacter sp.]|nr:alanine dehydrogenase [Thermaerobacter sp.]
QYGNRVTTLVSTPEHIADVLQDVDLLISGVLVPGARAPRLVTEAMVKSMKPGSVIVDVAIDQGGSVETCDHTTTHADPVYLKHNVVHYSVANMPGAVPRTSTVALTNATLPYIQSIAQMSIDEILKSPALAAGLNVYDGKLTNYEVAQALELDYAPLM